MSDDSHERAERLIAQARVEGITPEERVWLDRHTEECARCAGLSDATERALRSLRSVTVRVDPELVNRTQLMVRFRANQLERERAGMLPVWVCCAISWILGLVTAPLVWRGFEWLGRHAGVPNLMWQAAFVAWWLLPAIVAAAALALRRPESGRAGL
ncbi:MAG: hypothetical protein ACLQOO_25090 [Terriglobia bacterium]